MTIQITPVPYQKRDWISPGTQLDILWAKTEEKLQNLNTLIPKCGETVLEYTNEKWVSNWYTALKKLNVLPELIPPLPENIATIMESPCPIYGGDLQIKDTHFLQLIPVEFKNLHHLEYRILRPYAEQNPDKKFLRFKEFPREIYEDQRDVPFLIPQWVLMPKEILPESRTKNWYEHIKSIETLSQKSLPKYEIPTLQQFFAATSLHGVATDEKSSYATIQTDKGIRQTFTRVKDPIKGDDGLIIGGLTPSGFCVSTGPYASRFDTEHIGITPICRL